MNKKQALDHRELTVQEGVTQLQYMVISAVVEEQSGGFRGKVYMFYQNL